MMVTCDNGQTWPTDKVSFKIYFRFRCIYTGFRPDIYRSFNLYIFITSNYRIQPKLSATH